MNQIDIIVPARNEAENIEELARRIDQSMTSAKIDYSLIIVDDHSSDGTADKAKELSKSYPIKLHIKKGEIGKAYAVLEGFELSTAPYICLIDADLQYPPEAIPKMFKLARDQGVSVANRRTHKTNFLRKIGSKINVLLFEKLLLGFNCDTQSGLKVFKREIIEHLEIHEVTPWTLDMPLLHTARELGYSIGIVDIDFEDRKNGKSKVHFIKTAFEIALGAIKLRFRKRRIYHLKPPEEDSMLHSGVVYKGKRFITHTTLHHTKSALIVITPLQGFLIGIFLGLFIAGFILNTKLTAIIFIAFLSTIYFLDVIFNLFLVLKSLHFPPEIKISDEDIGILGDNDLPIYSILCPLYKEADVLPQFLQAIDKLEWPKDKLDVLLLLEEDDKETTRRTEEIFLPNYVRKIIVPHSLPKTKPKACNYGLSLAKGEYVVIYDAEDVPEPLQLKKAYLAFQKLPRNIFCLQAKLNYYNPHHNLLTRLFTAEYSLWFDVILPGFQSIETTIPLGGTSNHFRTADLIKLEGWDPFNVTEDCDLGVRLFKEGYKTAIIDSVTLEEANSNLKNWLRQRSRWIKGYLQTYLVHMRNPIKFAKESGIHALIFQLVAGMRMSFMIINPFLWLATISYFTLYSLVGPVIESLYPAPVFYMAVTSLIFGNFLYLYYYMIGAAKRGHWSVIKYIFFVPFYWILVSVGASIAFYQLIFKPHYWEKTIHGLHLAKEEERKKNEILRAERTRIIKGYAGSGFVGGGVLIAATIFSNFTNFLYNAYLGRSISHEEFGLVSIFVSFLYIAQVPFSALSKTISYRGAYLLGKYKVPVKSFWTYVRNRSAFVSLGLTLVWIALIPLLAGFFNSETLIPFFIFAPVWLLGLTYAVDSGFISGNLKFYLAAFLLVLEALIRFGITIILVFLGLSQWVYLAIPLSMTASLLIGWIFIKRMKIQEVKSNAKNLLYFPKHFFITSILTRISTIAFLSLDVILAKHFLPPKEAGEYALLSLVGKIVFFLGSQFSQFITPLVSKAEGEGRHSTKVFNKLILATSLSTLTGFIGVGVFGEITVPILFGTKAGGLISLLPFYTSGIAVFTLASAIVNFHQIKKEYLFPFTGFLISTVQVITIIFFHSNVAAIAQVTAIFGFLHLGYVSFLHVTYPYLVIVTNNIIDFLGLFGKRHVSREAFNEKLNILIFNWRDTKHTWAGGAEVYVQEIAKRWVKYGNKVTVFCGNDGKNPRNEVVDGLQVVRRGGFYTVYLWAFLYYILKFRGLFDVVIDSANGVPFFTPVYVRVPKFLILYHVHQEVFRKHLILPLSAVARFVESVFTPSVYRNEKIITISESSRKDLVKLGFNKEKISIVTPGVEIKRYKSLEKTSHPSFIYLGRLKPYKNVDIAIKAFAEVVSKYPPAKLTIAGEGESMKGLKSLVLALHLEESVNFVGRVTEKEKFKTLAKSWVAIQPSSFEGWGITVIEANSVGTPVIASKVSGLCDSVLDGKTGLLVSVKNETLTAKAMLDLTKDRSFRKYLSREALKWAKNFNWDEKADSFLKIMKNEPTPTFDYPITKYYNMERNFIKQ